jgi:hypothetical protein
MELSSSLEQAQILPQRRLDPSLRINSGPLPFHLGEGVSWERSALPNNGGTLPPSNGEYFVGRESRGAKGEEDIPEYLGGSVESVESRNLMPEIFSRGLCLSVENLLSLLAGSAIMDGKQVI